MSRPFKANIPNEADPTATTYDALVEAYDFFNSELFASALPHCLITLQRKNKSFGYFAPKRFGGPAEVDEIALNPRNFDRSAQEVLSTLVHEMVHLWQQHIGSPPKRNYHNVEWADRMEQVGLSPSTTGAPGGKRTGSRVSHYITPDGLFDNVSRAFLEGRPPFLYHDVVEETVRARKAASKTKFTCPLCGLNAWAKPGSELMCAGDQELMQAEGGNDVPTAPEGSDAETS